MKTKQTTLRLAILLCLASPAWAQASLDEAMRAEAAQQWDEAARLYRNTLKQTPDAGTWQRLSDVEARRGQAVAAAEALEQAARLKPHDADLALKVAQAWAQAGRAKEALAACERADSLRPGDEAILRTCAVHANWAGDAALSARYWRELLAKYSTQPEERLHYAQALSWSGQLDEAARVFRAYLAESPQNEAAWLDYVRTLTWMGDYAGADAALEDYRQRFGETTAWHATRGRMLAWADWPDAASRHIDPLLASQPEDYETLYTQTVILRQGNRPKEALATLAKVQALRPDSRDTYDLTRVTRLPHRPAVTLGGFAYQDSDDIDVVRADIRGVLPLNERTALLLGGGTERLSTRAGSVFQTLTGERSVTLQDAWLGVRHRVTPWLGMEAQVGGVRVDDFGEHMTGALLAEFRPSDPLRLSLSASRTPHMPSPLAASYEVMADQLMARFNWRPTLGTTVEGYVAQANLSDDNARKELYLAPRVAVLRSQSFNLDTGVSARWLDYRHHFDHGYYSPDDYRRYAFDLYGYWKIDDDNAVGMTASLGWYKDAAMSGYEFGSNLMLEGFFGIYKDTYLHLWGGYGSQSLATGRYDAWSVRVEVTQRF
ncbi:MAG: tetratricopeptide repeat protein [Pseudomonadota bacterium]